MTEEKKDKFGFVAVQLSRKMWLGNNKLQGDEIGLDFEALPKDVQDIIKLGSKRMYPKDIRESFVGIYMKAYHYLQANSLPFITDHIRAVPKAKLAEVVARLELFQQEYYEFKVDFIRNYEDMKAKWEDKYRGPIWNSMQGFYPHKDELAKKFDLFWNVFEVSSATYSATSSQEVAVAYQKAKQELERRMGEMVEESITYLRAKASSTVKNLAERLRTGAICTEKTIGSVRNVEQWFRELNIFGDKGVEEDLKTLRVALQGVESGDLKEDDALRARIIELADKVVATADKLEDVNTLTNEYKRTLEI
jgi:hypothetical protein